jgi:TetR/AcrR family transcriptional regulator, transcriptional repressor for nem operon
MPVHGSIADSGPDTPVVVSTRERLLVAAMELFTTQGYEATSVAEILKRAGVNSGSLYYFFDNKHDLLVEGLEFFKTLLYPIVMQPAFAREADPIERIFAVLEDYRRRLLITDLDYECPVGKLALEVARQSQDAREKIAANFGAWRDHIRDCLDQAADRLPGNVDRNGLATFVLTTMEGAVMQARTHRNISYFDSSIANLRAYFGYLLSETLNPGAG